MLKLLILLGVLSVAFSGVTKEEVEHFKEILGKVKDDGLTLEERMAANPESSPWVNSGKFEGDMLIEPDQAETLLETLSSEDRMAWRGVQWPSNTVIYEFGATFTNNQRNMIMESIRDIERNTCVRFRLRTNERAFVRLLNRNDGCYAHVGHRNNFVNTLNLANGCFRHVIIVHEWLHALGFMHMQSTYNRDDYVRILWQNIQRGMEHNFEMYRSNVMDNLGAPYEYISSMHYDARAFSVNGQPTIQATRPFNGVMGGSTVSSWDWTRVRRYYSCPGAWNDDVQAAEENQE